MVFLALNIFLQKYGDLATNVYLYIIFESRRWVVGRSEFDVKWGMNGRTGIVYVYMNPRVCRPSQVALQTVFYSFFIRSSHYLFPVPLHEEAAGWVGLFQHLRSLWRT